MDEMKSEAVKADVDLNSPERQWVIRELVAEIEWREAERAQLIERELRWKTACTYMGRHGCTNNEVKGLCRKIVSSMPMATVEGYAMNLRILE